MVDTVQVRVSKKAHKKLVELSQTPMGTVRIYQVIERLIEFYEKQGGKSK
ncbi:hypothetical protein ACFLQN_02185 [Candidatus Aenigmatarchaeota archaeon]